MSRLESIVLQRVTDNEQTHRQPCQRQKGGGLRQTIFRRNGERSTRFPGGKSMRITREHRGHGFGIKLTGQAPR